MIVRNESAVIRRCLESLVKWIDYWVIVDTGSTDGTQKIVKDALREIPGELHERPWVDFAHCRNEALALAKGRGGYLLFIDSDESFFPMEGFCWRNLDRDGYLIELLLENGAVAQRLFLARSDIQWEWKGAIHEELSSLEPRVYEVLRGASLIVVQDGSRSQDGKKHLKDAELLEKEVEKNPACSRSIFYLAGSYEMAKEYGKALFWYQRRACMDGWGEEVYYALYRIGALQEKLRRPKEEIFRSYCKAYENRPVRAEPLFMLANALLDLLLPLLAFLLASFALKLRQPDDRVFVEREVYEYKLLTQKADSATLLGLYSIAAEVLALALTKKMLPEDKRAKIERALPLLLAK